MKECKLLNNEVGGMPAASSEQHQLGNLLFQYTYIPEPFADEIPAGNNKCLIYYFEWPIPK